MLVLGYVKSSLPSVLSTMNHKAIKVCNPSSKSGSTVCTGATNVSSTTAVIYVRPVISGLLKREKW